MNFISIRELKSEGSQVAERLKSKGDLVLTNHGKPVAMLVPVGEGELEQVSREIKLARGRLAWARISAAAKAGGLDRLRSSDVEREIKAARAERRPKANRASRGA